MTNIKKLQLISLIGGMYYYTPIFTLLLLQRSISLGFIVAAQTVFSVAMMLSVVPTGLLADRFGQKLTIQVGLVLDALGMLLLLFVHNPVGLIIFFALRGVSVGFRSGSDEALLYDSYVDEHKTAEGYSRSYGTMVSNDILGFVVATAVAGFAVALFGDASYNPLVVATGLTTLAALAVASTLKRKTHRVEHDKRGNMFGQLKQGVKVVTKSRTITALTIAGLLTLNGEYFLRQTYQPFFQDMMVPALFLGLALSAGKLLNFAVIRNVHKLEEFLTVDRIILWVNLLLGIAFIAFALVRSVWALVLVFVIIQALLNAERPVVSDYINQRIGPGQRSTVLSTVSFALNIGQIVARLALGLSIGLVGMGSTFIVQGVYLVIGSIIGVWYLRRCGCVHRVKHNLSDVIEQPVTI